MISSVKAQQLKQIVFWSVYLDTKWTVLFSILRAWYQTLVQALPKLFYTSFSHQFANVKLWHLGTKNYTHIHCSTLWYRFMSSSHIWNYFLLNFLVPFAYIITCCILLRLTSPLLLLTLKSAKKSSWCPSLRVKLSFIIPKFIRAWKHQVTP